MRRSLIVTPEEHRQEMRSQEGLTLFSPEDLFGKERGACGIGAVVNRLGEANRTVVELVLAGLCDLDLRGGKVEKTGDGAGVMFRTRGLRKFLEQFLSAGTRVPEGKEIYMGNFFVPAKDGENFPILLDEMKRILGEKGFRVVGHRTSEHFTSPRDTLYVNPEGMGVRALESLPIFVQILFTNEYNTDESMPYALHQAKLQLSAQMKSVYAVSLEKGTATYKTMATGAQLQKLFQTDFLDPDFMSDAGTFHTRFATNVLSRPDLAQPFRRLLHNGEINTIRALRAAIRDLERSLRMEHSVLMREGSDSGDIDRMISLFYAHGVPLSESLRRIFQPTPDDIELMPHERQMYHRAVRQALGPLSAAEGPAGIIAMDSEELVALLDGLGLRPLRAIILKNGLLVITSEIGAPHIPLDEIEETFQFDAGEMMVVKNDGKVLFPDEAEDSLVSSTELNYRELAGENGTSIFLPATRKAPRRKEKKETKQEICTRLNMFGGNEDLVQRVTMMAKEGKEPVIGMGNDQPLAVFSKARHRLAQYFHQIVAVVTNPPMDPIREGASMNLRTYLGRRPKAHEHGHRYKPQPHIELEHPVLGEEQFQNLLHPGRGKKSLRVHRISTAVQGTTEKDMRDRIEQIKRDARKIARGKKHPVIVISDRDVKEDGLYIPPALIAAVIHEDLRNFGLRRHVSIVCDTGEAFEAHDIALLLAMGADAVNPYLMWQSIETGVMTADGVNAETLKKNLMNNYVAMIKRIMSKMGITSIEGYRGSMLMEAVGIDPSVIQFFMKCPVANIGGITLQDMVDDILERSKLKNEVARNPDKGAYDRPIQRIMEEIMFGKKYATPKEAYRAFIQLVEAYQEKYPVYLRDLLELVPPDGNIDLSKVMGEEELFKDHIRGTAMSHGALTLPAHRAIAGALNELGGMSNSGEGGELPERNKGGMWENDRSKIRQRASAMFGFNAEYAINAEEIEIKIGQGAKPGEGGHLPGFKVGPLIAKMRHTQVGIDLISPPPLHDVYSIEDLARLIQDLRAVNPKARIAVKITANTDIGTVAVGVAKAGADVISLSGFEGGTGAAVSSAIEHTGLPLELSLAEVHQALTRNKIRDLVKIRVDGGIKRGDDIVKLACLGADEFGLGTALIVAGERCIFCHSCSGQAKGVQPGTFTQCPTDIMAVAPAGKLGLGARTIKEGDEISEEESYHLCKEATKHYLKLVAEDVREILARLGKKNIKDIVGDTTLLRQIERTKEANRVRLDELLRDVRPDIIEAQREAAKHEVDRTLTKPAVNEANQYLIDQVAEKLGVAVDEIESIEITYDLKTSDRSFGATLAGKIAGKEFKVPKNGIRIRARGYAGQSLGFCNVEGMTIELDGFANDFVSMGQSGGKVILRQPKSCYKPKNSIAGNACAYGASGGKLFGAGKFGQRLGVRNCGAILISEGSGKYPYEYMTGGIGIDLRRVGNKAGSGMTGGKLFLFDEDGTLNKRLHKDVTSTHWTKHDKKLLYDLLTEYVADTESELGRHILDHFDELFSSFKRVVPKDHYVNAVTSVLSYDFYRMPDAPEFEEVLYDATIEIMAYLGLHEDQPDFERVKEALRAAKAPFEEKIEREAEAEMREKLKLGPNAELPAKPKLPAPPYRFEQAKEFSRGILKTLLHSPSLP